MKLLAIGDVFGNPGRKAVMRWLPGLREESGADFVVVNVENIHAGRGADPASVRDVLLAGADCLTSGNHIWGHRSHAKLLEDERRLLRPANYPDPCPGRGVEIFPSAAGWKVAVINLQGRIFMPPVDDPFRAADEILDEVAGLADVRIVDFHAEATSEKLAMGRHLDSRVAAVFGTHTHVQTADARVLGGGTGFITDLGMTGPYESVIGMDTAAALARFRTGRPMRAAPAQEDPGLRGALFEIDPESGRCLGVERIQRGGGGH
ncbi:MAG: TIGR00282 family metallophosphoesterase [Acidobacteriota bacterium]|nr:TIGR00282 family metallophosphoesterase [Acidobacteriota bacterium]